MAGSRLLSKESIDEIIRRYDAGEAMHSICKDYGVDYRTGHYWYTKLKKGVDPNAYKKANRGGKKRVCHKCGNTEHSSKAQYCCICGAKLKSDADFLIDDINYIADMTQFFPASTRDKIIATVNKAVAYIKAAEKEKKDNGNDL